MGLKQMFLFLLTYAAIVLGILVCCPATAATCYYDAYGNRYCYNNFPRFNRGWQQVRAPAFSRAVLPQATRVQIPNSTFNEADFIPRVGDIEPDGAIVVAVSEPVVTSVQTTQVVSATPVVYASYAEPVVEVCPICGRVRNANLYAGQVYRSNTRFMERGPVRRILLRGRQRRMNRRYNASMCSNIPRNGVFAAYSV